MASPYAIFKRPLGFMPKGVARVDALDPINNGLAAATLFGDALTFDVSGKGHNGVITNSQGFVNSNLGIAYKTVGFTNSTNNISNLSLNTNNFSFVLFAKTQNTNGGQNGYLDWISFLDSNGQVGILERNGNSPFGPFFFNLSGATYGFGNVLGTDTTDGKWQQLACTFNNGVGQLYQKGQPIDSGTGTWNSTITQAQIGNRITQGSRTPDALIAGVRLYSRVLRQDEILRLNADPFAGLFFATDKIKTAIGGLFFTGSAAPSESSPALALSASEIFTATLAPSETQSINLSLSEIFGVNLGLLESNPAFAASLAEIFSASLSPSETQAINISLSEIFKITAAANQPPDLISIHIMYNLLKIKLGLVSDNALYQSTASDKPLYNSTASDSPP